MNEALIELFLESGEYVADGLTKSEVLADVPVVGTAYRLLRARDSIRDQAFMAKISRFAKHLSSVPPEVKEKMKDRMAASSEQARKVGETLFLVLERLTDLAKADVLAFVFLAYIDGVVEESDLRRLAVAIDLAFMDDLAALLRAAELPVQGEMSIGWMAGLTNTGLMIIKTGVTWDSTGAAFCHPTELARTLREAHSYGQSLSASAHHQSKSP